MTASPPRWTALPTPSLGRAAAAVVGLVAALAPAPRAAANMAAPWDPGQVVGEPVAALAGAHVVRERLTVDLRPAATRAPATVEAVYDVRLDGEARELVLEFVATDLTEPAVTLDGRALAFEARDLEEAPASWRPPELGPTTLPAEEATWESWRPLRALRFAAALAPGEHRIEVRYAVEPGTLHPAAPYRERQLAYPLAPARHWAGFGTLEVRVELPPGWLAVSEPALARDGDALVGRFEGVPADQLLVATGPPQPAVDALPPLPAGAAVSVVLALLVGGLLGRGLGLADARRLRAFVAALGLACAAFVAGGVAVWLFARLGAAGLEPLWISRRFSYSRAFATLGGALFAGLLAATAALVGVALGQRRGRREAAAAARFAGARPGSA